MYSLALGAQSQFKSGYILVLCVLLDNHLNCDRELVALLCLCFWCFLTVIICSVALSQRCYGLVCSVLLWYVLLILAYLFGCFTLYKRKDCMNLRIIFSLCSKPDWSPALKTCHFPLHELNFKPVHVYDAHIGDTIGSQIKEYHNRTLCRPTHCIMRKNNRTLSLP